MWNRDAGTDTGADHVLPGLEGIKSVFSQRLHEFSGLYQVIHQFHNRRPVLPRLHVEDDLVRTEQLGQLHKTVNNLRKALRWWQVGTFAIQCWQEDFRALVVP